MILLSFFIIAIKLQKQLADIISKVSPCDLVSFDAIESAMDNLPIKEKSFKGMLSPNKSFAYSTNEVSRDAFGGFSGADKPPEDMEQSYANVPIMKQMNSKEALPQMSSLHHQVPHQLPLPIPASMTYTQHSRAAASQVPMRMSYGISQGMNTQVHASYQMTYPRPLSAPSHVSPYYPSQRYPPSYGYPYYPQYGYPMGQSSWQQRPNYY